MASADLVSSNAVSRSGPAFMIAVRDVLTQAQSAVHMVRRSCRGTNEAKAVTQGNVGHASLPRAHRLVTAGRP